MAVAAKRGIKDITNKNVQIKWVNDIFKVLILSYLTKDGLFLTYLLKIIEEF